MKEDVAKTTEDETVLPISNACLLKVWERDFHCMSIVWQYSMKQVTKNLLYEKVGAI